MKFLPQEFVAAVRGRRRLVRIISEGEGFAFEIDGVAHRVALLEAGLDHTSILIDGVPHELSARAEGRGRYRVSLGGNEVAVEVNHGFAARIVRPSSAGSADGPIEVRSPMHGLVVQVHVRVGDVVEAQAPLLILEAMKMQNAISTPNRCVVRRILVEPGQTVEGEALLAILERQG